MCKAGYQEGFCSPHRKDGFNGVMALGLGLQTRLGGKTLLWWDQAGCTLWACRGSERLCKAGDSGSAGGATRGALSSTSPAELQSPPWGWSKLIPSSLLALPIRRQQESIPTRAVCKTSGFLPLSEHTSVTQVPQQRGDNPSGRNARTDPTLIERQKGTLPLLLEDPGLGEAAGGCASPADCREPSAALFLEIHPAHQPWSCCLPGTSPERVCAPSRRAGQQRQRRSCHSGSDNI